MNKVKVAIFGAAGYAGEELLRILTRHRQCEIVAITSRKNAGQPISTVFPRFTNSGLTFVMPDAASLKGKCDAAILALPHGLATEFAIPLLEQGIKVFDISADFRLKSPEKYKEYYGEEHPAKDLLAKAVYGLPERYRSEIAKADLVACPGCYPTSSILPTAPLLAAGLVSTKNIAVVSCSGVTGAGRKVDLAYIFPNATNPSRLTKFTVTAICPKSNRKWQQPQKSMKWLSTSFLIWFPPTAASIQPFFSMQCPAAQWKKSHRFTKKHTAKNSSSVFFPQAAPLIPSMSQ